MLSNLVLETCNAPGNAATITLAGSPTGRVPFASAFATGASCFYVMDDGVQQEAGVGTFTAGGPNALTRTTVLWTSAVGHASPIRLNFTGSTRVYNSLPAERAVYGDALGRVGIRAPAETQATLLVYGSNAELNTIQITVPAGGYNPSVVMFGAAYAWASRVDQTAGGYELLDSGQTNLRFRVTAAGACYNITGTYGTLSDETLKENIAPARSYLADLRQINVVNYSLKKDKLPAANMLGVLAQQVESLIPGLVEDAPGDPATPGGTGESTKYVKSSVLIFMLLQALQELAAKVDALTPPHAPAT